MLHGLSDPIQPLVAMQLHDVKRTNLYDMRHLVRRRINENTHAGCSPVGIFGQFAARVTSTYRGLLW